jgi:hypothetical protein
LGKELFVQILHGIPTESWVFRHAGSRYAIMLAEEYSQRELAIHFAKTWHDHIHTSSMHVLSK